MAITPNTTFTAGNVLTAAQMNRLPWGVLGLLRSTTAFNTSATHTNYQDDGLSVSVAYQANRILRATWITAVYVAGGVNTINAKLVRGSTDVMEWSFPSEVLATGFALSVTESIVFQGPVSAATETFKIQIRASTNNTRVDEFASAAAPRALLIEDLGQA